MKLMWPSESMMLVERGTGSDIDAGMGLLLATGVPEVKGPGSVPVDGE
jgi:hypothetical protein